MVDPDQIATAKQLLTDRTDKDPDGWMDQCAMYLLNNMPGLRLFQAVGIIAQLRTDGWLEQRPLPDNTFDRIVG